MGKIKNRIISLAAACLFAVGLLPSAVSADDEPILFVNGKDIIAAETTRFSVEPVRRFMMRLRTHLHLTTHR